MEIITKHYRDKREWLAGIPAKNLVWETFTGASLAGKHWLQQHPEGVVERHICEHTTFKIWRAGDDLSIA